MQHAFKNRLLTRFLIGKLEGSVSLENTSMGKIVSKWALMTESERVVNYFLLARNRVQLHSVVKVKQSPYRSGEALRFPGS